MRAHEDGFVADVIFDWLRVLPGSKQQGCPNKGSQQKLLSRLWQQTCQMACDQQHCLFRQNLPRVRT